MNELKKTEWDKSLAEMRHKSEVALANSTKGRHANTNETLGVKIRARRHHKQKTTELKHAVEHTSKSKLSRTKAQSEYTSFKAYLKQQIKYADMEIKNLFSDLRINLYKIDCALNYLIKDG